MAMYQYQPLRYWQEFTLLYDAALATFQHAETASEALEVVVIEKDGLIDPRFALRRSVENTSGPIEDYHRRFLLNLPWRADRAL